MKKNYFTKKLTKSNLGRAKMKDKYITVPKGQVDPIIFFGNPPMDIKCYDKSLDSYFTFPLILQDNGEYRLSKFTAYYNSKNAELGNIVKIVRKKTNSEPKWSYYIELIKQTQTKHDIYLLPDEELVPDALLEEGSKMKVAVNKYERNKKARDKCVKHWKAICAVCKMEFKQRYGKIGNGFINVHHLNPVSKMGGAYIVDPIKDLIPVCPNCHSMIHKRKPPFTVDEMSKMLHNQYKK